MFVGAASATLIASSVLKHFIEPQMEKRNIHIESRKTAQTICALLSGAGGLTMWFSSGTVKKVSFYSCFAFTMAGIVVEPEETKINNLTQAMIFTIPLALSEAWMRKYA